MERQNSLNSTKSCTEELDPRIHLELEKLNSSTDQINKLETELEETNEKFRVLLSSHAAELEKMMRKLGSKIDKARPYYIAKGEAEDLQKKCLEASVAFLKSNDIHSEARKSVLQAEGRYSSAKESHFDAASQEAALEMLNHLTTKVMEAEKQKSANEFRHRVLSERFFVAEKKVHELEKVLQSAIQQSKSYFDMKNSLNSTLNDLKTRTMKLSTCITEAKRTYSLALGKLELISEEIHLRNGTMGCSQRTPGEGAEEEKKKLDE